MTETNAIESTGAAGIAVAGVVDVPHPFDPLTSSYVLNPGRRLVVAVRHADGLEATMVGLGRDAGDGLVVAVNPGVGAAVRIVNQYGEVLGEVDSEGCFRSYLL